jgi:hypothetical protein
MPERLPRAARRSHVSTEDAPAASGQLGRLFHLIAPVGPHRESRAARIAYLVRLGAGCAIVVPDRIRRRLVRASPHHV